MSATANPGGRYALIVAVSDYHDPKLRQLRAPAADAQRLAAVLENPDIGAFAVDVALNESESVMRRRIATFFANRRPEDLLLVHFSCHGIKDDRGELYLTAADTEVGDLLGATGVSSAWLSEQVGRSRSKRVVMFLDCCFSGSFPFGMRPRAGESVDVHQHLDGRGRAVITASSAMEYSYEGDELSGHGEPSIFTEAVVEGLETGEADRDGDSWISVDELYEYVYDRVKDRTPSQTPNKLSTLEGPLRIARSIYVAPVLPAELDEQILELVEHPVAGARLGAVDELATLLRSSNDGVALSARQTLERMCGDDSRRVAERAAAVLGGAPRVEPPAPVPAAAAELAAAPKPAAKPTLGTKPSPTPQPVGAPRELPGWWNRYGYVVWALGAATLGAYISTFFAWPSFNSSPPALVVGNLLLALPVAVATVWALLASQRVQAPLSIAAVAVAIGGVVAGVAAGLVPAPDSASHGYFALTSAIAGAGLGLAVGVLLRDRWLMATGAVAGALGGALSAPLIPLNGHKSTFVTLAVASTVLAAIPVLALLAVRNRDAPRPPT